MEAITRIESCLKIGISPNICDLRALIEHVRKESQKSCLNCDGVNKKNESKNDALLNQSVEK